MLLVRAYPSDPQSKERKEAGETDRLLFFDYLLGWLNVNTRCVYLDLGRNSKASDNLTLAPVIDMINHQDNRLVRWPSACSVAGFLMLLSSDKTCLDYSWRAIFPFPSLRLKRPTVASWRRTLLLLRRPRGRDALDGVRFHSWHQPVQQC